MGNLLNVSPSPHAHGKETTHKKLMFGVILALLPSLFTSVFYFGWGAIIVTSVSVASCLLFEYLIRKFIFKKPITITERISPCNRIAPWHSMYRQIFRYSLWWIGAFISIAVAKMTFGGLGNNPFNLRL